MELQLWSPSRAQEGVPIPKPKCLYHTHCTILPGPALHSKQQAAILRVPYYYCRELAVVPLHRPSQSLSASTRWKR